MTPHLNHLNEMVQMRGHNIPFYAELTKIIPNHNQILLLIYSFVKLCFLVNDVDDYVCVFKNVAFRRNLPQNLNLIEL